MSDEADPGVAGLPSPPAGGDARAGHGAVRPRPRNYLDRGERQRLLWRFMPLALAVTLGMTLVEWVWFRSPPPARQPRIDTSLEAIRGGLPTDGAVVIEPDPEPFVPTADRLGATPDMLASVRDDTFFREGDMQAWLHTLLTLRDAGQEVILRGPAERVSFSELFGQPRTFRGRAVRIRGTLHRLERLAAPSNNYGIEAYWQGWLEPSSGPAEPVVVHFLRVPPGMPTGMKINEPVDVVGYFLKRYAYDAADRIRVAPLVLALEPVWKPVQPAAPGGTSLGTVALVSMIAIVAATAAAMSLANRRRPAPPPAAAVDLNRELAGVETLSTAESLRRLERTERSAGGSIEETKP